MPRQRVPRRSSLCLRVSVVKRCSCPSAISHQLPQLAPKNLARRGARQRLHEINFARHFVVRQPLRHERLKQCWRFPDYPSRARARQQKRREALLLKRRYATPHRNRAPGDVPAARSQPRREQWKSPCTSSSPCGDRRRSTSPHSSTRTISPVQYQPSRRTAAVASGDFQYPSMNCGPRMTNSPMSPGATSLFFLVEHATLSLSHGRADRIRPV